MNTDNTPTSPGVSTREPSNPPPHAPPLTMMNYDPNLTLCGRMADQMVKLTFAIWEYRTTMLVPVGGNTTGLSVIRAAISFAFDKVPTEKFGDEDVAYLELTRQSDGATMRVDDEDDDGEDWLADMCIAAEIISIAPQVEKPDETEKDADAKTED